MDSKKILLAFLGGIAVGAIAGILLAPDKGSNTRKAFQGVAEDLSEAMESGLHDAMDKVKSRYADVIARGEEMVEEVLSGLHQKEEPGTNGKPA